MFVFCIQAFSNVNLSPLGRLHYLLFFFLCIAWTEIQSTRNAAMGEPPIAHDKITHCSYATELDSDNNN